MSMNAIGIQVRDLMSHPVITVTLKETMEEVSKMMAKNNCGSIVITSAQDDLAGIITERDIVTRLTAMNRVTSQVTADDFMSHPLMTIAAYQDIKDAAKVMKEQRIRRMVVVESGNITGIITSRDIFDEMVPGER